MHGHFVQPDVALQALERTRLGNLDDTGFAIEVGKDLAGGHLGFLQTVAETVKPIGREIGTGQRGAKKDGTRDRHLGRQADDE